MPRNYHQFCAVARALDVVGERWTLLIVRELMLGPRRYGELLDALDGIGTNLLADRLAAMRDQGLVTRAGREYGLTERGHGLEDAVLALARFAMAPMAEPQEGERLRPDWYAVAMVAGHRAASPAGDEVYEFAIDDSVFHVGVRGGRPFARRGAAEQPALRLRANLATFLGIATRALPATAAELEGDGRAAERWLEAFSLPRPVAVRTPRRAARAPRASR